MITRDRQDEILASQSLTILVIDASPVGASIIETGLRDASYDKITVVHDIAGVAWTVTETDPDVIMISLEGAKRDALEEIFQLPRSVKRPIAMFVDRSDRAAIEAAIDAGISAFVVDGLKRQRVKPVLDIAIVRFNALSRRSRELEEARSELKDRKLVERAKDILMTSRRLSEEEAYALLRETTAIQNRKVADIAQSLITAAGLLGPAEQP